MGKNDPIIIRCLAIVSDIIAFSLVAAGAKNCYPSDCIISLDITLWKYLHKTGGQYFVFVATLVLIIATAAVLFMAMRNIIKQKLTLIIFDAVAAFLCLLFAGLEIYYGCIYVPRADTSHPPEDLATLETLAKIELGRFYYKYNQSWVAALVFYLLSAITYAVLAVLNRQ